jgi:DNA-binding response OmpR family regulator
LSSTSRCRIQTASLCRRGSAPTASRFPVLFLSARDAVADRVHGLTLGADDYMTKPFSLEELVARIRTVLRRTTNPASDPHPLSFADLELDDETRDVRRGRRRIDLSPTEFSLLRYLLLNSRKVVSKSQILDHVWQYREERREREAKELRTMRFELEHQHDLDDERRHCHHPRSDPQHPHGYIFRLSPGLRNQCQHRISFLGSADVHAGRTL